MEIQVAGRLTHTEEYYFSKKLREIAALNKSGEPVINLGIGSPDMPPHPDVIATLSEYAAKPTVHGYQSYQGIPALRKAIASFYERYYDVVLNPDNEVLPLIGSKEGIMHICMTYLQEGDEALIPNPGYPTYASAVRLSGAIGVPYNLKAEDGWLPDLDALEADNLGRVKLMWVNYPHMPTGAAADPAFFERLVAFARRNNILLCHDNPYSFILNDTPRSLLAVPGAKDVALELNSLSKSGNMAGWRIGMLLGDKERLSEVIRFKSNMDSGSFLPMQMAAVKALELGPDWYEVLNAVYRKRREKVYALLDLLKCHYDKKQVGLFIWASIPTGYTDGYAVSDEILQKTRVFITPGGIFGSEGNGYVRVSLCTSEQVLDEAIARIKG